MPQSEQKFPKYVRVTEFLYLFMIACSFYLLLISRTGEARTVWEVLHPSFVPTLLIATLLLFTIVFTSEKVAHKLLFIIAHSILIHSFFSIIFPAGDLSGQQMVLGRTRLVFDNAVLHGWTPWPTTIFQRVFEWLRGITLQTALSVVLARMLSIELLWVHLSLVPVLWGVFVPIAAFLTTRMLGAGDNVAVLASLLISAFPYATYFGAISVPNSLGFIFFFFSFYFMMKNIDSHDSKAKILMVAFSFFSFLFHFLTGIVSFSLLILSLAFKSYRDKKVSLGTAKVSLVIWFLVCASLLPVAFFCWRFLSARYKPAFTLDKFYELPVEEIVGLTLLGELVYSFDIGIIILTIVGPTLGFLYMIYLLYKMKKNPTVKFRTHLSFLSAAFLMILIDYRILKLFMERLPLNEERLWVFRDFISVPFVALAICGIVSSIASFLRARHPQSISIASLKALSKRNVLSVLTLLFTLNVLIPAVLGGWITYSLHAAYPKIAPLQTTSYELEAVRYIEENTGEKYVVIGDVWTIFAGEAIVGINNPRAYYFGEYNKTGHDLFVNMKKDPSPQWMRLAMNHTDTTIAYFIITEPRLGTEEYDRIVTQAAQSLHVYGVFGEGKLYVFYHAKEGNVQ